MTTPTAPIDTQAIAEQLLYYDIKLPDDATLFMLDDRVLLYIADMDTGMIIHRRGGIKGVSVHYDPRMKPPLSQVIPWGLPNEPITIAQQKFASINGVLKVETEYGATLHNIIVNVYVDPDETQNEQLRGVIYQRRDELEPRLDVQFYLRILPFRVRT